MSTDTTARANAEPGLRVNDRPEQTHLAPEWTLDPSQIDRCRLPGLHLRKVLLRDLPSHLDLTTALDAKQGIATRVGDLPDLGPPGQHDAVHRCGEARAAETCLRLGELRGDDLDVGCIGDRSGAALLDVLGRERTRSGHAFRALIFGGR